MSNLTPYNTSGLASAGALSRRPSAIERQINRQVSHELARVQGQSLIRAAQVDLEARLTDLKIGNAAGLATSAQQHVAALTAMEGELTKAVPLAASRLELIGNLTTIGISEILTNTISQLRRI